MKLTAIIAGLVAALSASAALAQTPFQTLPPNTVVGRIGVGQYGPPAAIPLSTLSANLGFSVPSHYVPIGKGSTTGGFNSAATGTAGAVLVDQGSGSDPAFVAVSGSCTLAANGAMSCGTTGGGVTSISANYTALAADCSKTIAAGGNLQYTITVQSATNYGACALDISNVDAWGSGRGKVLNVTGLTTNPRVLYPGQTITLLNVGGVWFQKPGVVLSQAPVNTKLYVDAVNGLDNTNDCLTAASACQTLQYAVMGLIFQNLLTTAGSSTPNTPGFDIRLIADPACVPTSGANCIHGLHMSGVPKQVEGHNSIMIQCDAGTAANCTIADNTGNQAIGVYCACYLELKNVTLAGGNGNNNAIQVEKGMVRLEGGVVLAGTGSVPQLSTIDGGTIVLEGGTTTQVSGSASYFAAAQYGGRIGLDQATIQWTAATTYTSTLASFAGLITAGTTTWTTGGFVTATNKLQCTLGGVIDTNGGSASVPGTTTALGCSNSANGTYN